MLSRISVLAQVLYGSVVGTVQDPALEPTTANLPLAKAYGQTIAAKSLSFAEEDGWAGLPLWNWGPMVKRYYAPSGYDRR